jgi:very-short-patch-repair endonuclease
VRPVHPLRVGIDLTPDEARGPRYVRTSAGLYVPADTDRLLAQQRVIEVAAWLPPSAAVTGWASCLLHRAAWFDGLEPDGLSRLPVPVVVGPRGGVRRGPGVVVSFEALAEWQVWRRHGVRVTRPERAVFDEMRRHDQREALVALESALSGRITSLPRFSAFASTRRSARRYAVVAWAVPRARGGVRSPAEVRARTVAEEDAGWPRLLVNRVVRTSAGVRVGEVDLIDEDAPAAIEVDGADHREGVVQAWDITKEESLRQLGFEVARVTGRQALDPTTLAPRLVAVRERALARGPVERSWQLDPEDRDLERWLTERDEAAVFYENLPQARLSYRTVAGSNGRFDPPTVR